METLTSLIPEVSTNNVGNIAAFSLILKYLVDGIRYLASEVFNKELNLDPKVIAGLVVFVLLLIVNKDSISDFNQITTYAGEAVTLAATTWGVHKIVKTN